MNSPARSLWATSTAPRHGHDLPLDGGRYRQLLLRLALLGGGLLILLWAACVWLLVAEMVRWWLEFGAYPGPAELGQLPAWR